MNKEVFAKGVGKAVPVIGGVIAGGITLATFRPMGNRLVRALDESIFDYSQGDLKAVGQKPSECVQFYDLVDQKGRVHAIFAPSGLSW